VAIAAFWDIELGVATGGRAAPQPALAQTGPNTTKARWAELKKAHVMFLAIAAYADQRDSDNSFAARYRPPGKLLFGD